MLTTYKSAKDNRVTFYDGTLVALDTESGRILREVTPKIPFGIKTVSYKRFYRSTLEDIQTDRVLSVPFHADLYQDQRVEVRFFKESKEPKIYKVIQLLEKPDSAPPCLELDLQLVKTRFRDERGNV